MPAGFIIGVVFLFEIVHDMGGGAEWFQEWPSIDAELCANVAPISLRRINLVITDD